MAKKIEFTTDKMIDGLNKVADAVKVTMGARGRTVLLTRPFAGVVATKDGATVAKNIEMEDAEENIGAMLIKEVSKNVAEIAGDGTTTATVLTQALIKEGRKVIAAGAKPQDVVRGMEFATENAIAALDSFARPVSSNEEIMRVATISANGDTVLGQYIADATAKVGKDGVITVEEGRGLETEIDIVEGMQFDQGMMSPYFVTDQETMKCELIDTMVFVSEKRITNLKALLPVLEPIAQSGKPLLIIADDVDSEAVATLVLNRIKGGLKLCAVKAPGTGAQRKEILKDICVLTGATLITDDLGMSFETMTPDVLGSAKKIIVTKNTTTIIDGCGQPDNISARIEELRTSIENEKAPYAKEKMQERLARLTGGIAVIKVGGMTEVEVKEKKDRVDDAVAATKAAIEEGIVAGGGSALFYASKLCGHGTDASQDFGMGIQTVSKALLSPLYQIVENAGINGEVVANELRDLPFTSGYDVTHNHVIDMMTAGIIDPVKVVKTALKMAMSCATQCLLCGCVISDIPEKNEEKHPLQR